MRQALIDLAAALRFFSRLPVPALPGEADPHAAPDLRRIIRAVPVAGAIIGLVPALALLLSLALGFGPLLAAALAVAALTVATGAFHEDGLADTADGFGGGRTRDRRLAIMKDSRIGAFGASALCLGFVLRVAALATLAGRLDPPAAATAIVVAAMLSRTGALALLVLLPPARMEGASHAVGRLPARAFAGPASLAVGVALALGLLAGFPLSGLILAVLLPAGATLALARLSARLVGGQTGDVAGAAQQIGEIACLLGLLIAVPP